jgi:hypothetical protein
MLCSAIGKNPLAVTRFALPSPKFVSLSLPPGQTSVCRPHYDPLWVGLLVRPLYRAYCYTHASGIVTREDTRRHTPRHHVNSYSRLRLFWMSGCFCNFTRSSRCQLTYSSFPFTPVLSTAPILSCSYFWCLLTTLAISRENCVLICINFSFVLLCIGITTRLHGLQITRADSRGCYSRSRETTQRFVI